MAIFDDYATDPEVSRYLSWRPHFNVDTTIALIDSFIHNWESGKGEQVFVIARQSELERPLGTIGIRTKGHEVGFGYALAKRLWGRGYMTEALSALIVWSFSQPTVWRLRAFCNVENHASARVMEKVGMLREGRLRRFFIHPNISDEPRDCFLYSSVRDDFHGVNGG